MVINQWLPAAHAGDAVGNAALAYRQRLRRLGYGSEIFAIEADETMRAEVRPFSAAEAGSGNVTLLHFATPSPMSEALTTLKGVRALLYHNVTPPEFFAPWSADIARLAGEARRQLASLRGRVDVAMGVSEYNRQELQRLGFEVTGVLPLDVDVERLHRARPVPSLAHWLGDGLTNFLFVGRIVPNKCIEDIIRIAEHYKRYVDAYYRFIFVGRYDGLPGYYGMLRALLGRLGWLADRVVFTGPVPDDELATYYRNASVYVSMSEHEGFCAPLMEAMATDVPILAYASTAVPETLGDAGVMFAPKDIEHTAELLGVLAFDDDLRARIVAGQRRRLTSFSGNRVDDGLRALAGRFQ